MPTMSKVMICNMALSHIGAGKIEQLEEASPEAKSCRLWYDFAREQALEAFNWSFARKREALASHSEAPPPEWLYRYVYPARALTIREIVNPSGPDADAIPYTIEIDEGEQKSVLTNLAEAVALYTTNIQATQSYSRHFIITLSHLLAYYLTFELTGKQKMRATEQAAYINGLGVAPAHNANETVEKAPRDAEWIRARA
jgi:hypothetical protein